MSQAVYKRSFDRFRKMVLMAMFGSLMYISQLLMAFLPNIHMIAMFIAVLTIVYRKWALLAIFVYVMLNGLFGGFTVWWLPYIYTWPLLWLALMLIPKKMKLKYSIPIAAVICALHGFLFGVLCAPSQAIVYGFDFEQTLAWIAAGVYFDILHGVGNIVMSTLIYPLIKLLFRLERVSVEKGQ